MSVRRHVDDLFTGAYDDDLSALDEARFQSHLRSCPDCTAAYAEFTATVEALHELPKAHMARVVHLPSTAPEAEGSGRRRISLGSLNAGLLRRFPATALAGAVAVVLVLFALAHTGGGGTSATTSLAGGGQPANAPAVGSSGDHRPAAESACAQAITPVVSATPPAGFSHTVVDQSSSLPGEQLELAASSLLVAPGEPFTVYAQLSVPLASAGAPGAQSTTSAIRAVRPCVSVGVGSGALFAIPPVATPGVGSSGSSSGDFGGPVPNASGSGPLVTFTVPAGLAPGTLIHVQAVVPAGFDASGSPALTATLTITTR